MDHDEVSEQESQALADTDLVVRTRSGDSGAFGELWRRHYRAGVTVARNMTSSLDPDDLVQEAYTRIYQSIVAGGGPTGSFRAYLFTSIRNTAAAWGRARRETAYDELDGVEDPASEEHASEAALDRGLTHRAFQSLPTRWQEVLWYSEIEQMKPAEIAPLLGMKATAVAQLTFRAREGLREAWIQAHLRSVADGSECQWTIERLGAYARLNLGRRDHAKLERHLADCVRCSIVASEAKEVSSRLALVLLPLAVGAVGTASYLAVVQGGSAPLTALAAMPSSVVHGAVTGAPGGMAGVAAGSGAAGTGAAASGGVGAGAAAMGTTAGATTIGTVTTTAAATFGVAGGSALAGIGAASGLAAASLVVVGGVVAAAVVLPNAAPEPAPTPAVVSDVAPVVPALVPETDAGDFTLLLPAAPGPDPADLPVPPVLDDTGATGTASGTTADVPASDATGTGTGNGNAFAGTGNAGGGNTGGTSNGNANGSTGGDTGTGTGTNGNGNGNANGAGNGNANGAGNGNGNTGSSGDGTPTNGTGNGNGGVTGNGGSTGNGTPTNGTGNGNGGVTGNGNGAAKKSETTPQSQPRSARRSASADAAAAPAIEPVAVPAAPSAATAHTPQGSEKKTSADSATAVTDDPTPASPPQS